MAQQSSIKVHLGRQGRLVIPASLRKTLGLKSGDSMVARLEDGKLVLEKKELVLKKLHSRFSRISKKVSLVEELIAERRAEARREEERG